MQLHAVLLIPDFPAATLLCGEREPGAAVVISGAPPTQFVCALNEEARRNGVQEGMPLPEARVRFAVRQPEGKLRAFERKPEREELLRKRLLTVAETISPRFEDSGPGLVTFDFTGLRDPHASAHQLLAEAERLGFHDARVGVSRDRFTAHCAARLQRGVTNIYPGQEAGFLAVQPVDALPLEESERVVFKRWGLSQIGEVARLPVNDLVERFGKRGERIHTLAHGRDNTFLRAHTSPILLEEEENFDWEIVDLEPLAFVLSGMLERLCLKMQGGGLAAAGLKTSLKLVRGGVFERRIDLPSPLNDPRTLLSLLRIDLDAHPPGDAVEGVRVAARPTERRVVQFALFTPDRPHPEKLAVTLARLTALVGEDRVGAPAAVDTHQPGAAAVVPFTETKTALLSLPAVGGGSGCPARAELRFRCYRPPKSAQVVVRGERPVYVDSDLASGPVTERSGPWRVSGEWWTVEGWQFEEWDTEVEGRLYRACLDRASGRWLLAGEYD